ncbi:uncharacterized protein SPSK_05640 [Sporothrix schenckii 1099-18]|uniref:Uncharacterized protein n=1 Tax=Sporothrix schenckii 1099-18 TaxID=1397361 RepID=A0A0F2LSX8_SPOSC|nr:uncharacterized protein SPSK_05640 [Sporothrix schenckii 1099-18]KJR80593.1 hypothetical protein SPSK_05640 [Sporothrix schenckii 1099-18]
MEVESKRANTRLQKEGGRLFCYIESDLKACQDRRRSISKIWQDNDAERDEEEGESEMWELESKMQEREPEGKRRESWSSVYSKKRYANAVCMAWERKKEPEGSCMRKRRTEKAVAFAIVAVPKVSRFSLVVAERARRAQEESVSSRRTDECTGSSD